MNCKTRLDVQHRKEKKIRLNDRSSVVQ
uniref:Uncharacterized protein n=1 Tax=Arundo donax TaxID=35708 RepID=A0A0A9B1B6_ARUDO